MHRIIVELFGCFSVLPWVLCVYARKDKRRLQLMAVVCPLRPLVGLRAILLTLLVQPND